MTYASPSHDKFPNRGRWSPARWADRSPPKIPNPPPKADEYPVYGDYNVPDPNPYTEYVGSIKVEITPGSTWASVFFYPVLNNRDGYETGEDLLDYRGIVVGKKHDDFDPIHLAPRLVAIVSGKNKNKVLARARREALYLSTEPDDLGPRILVPITIDIDNHKIRLVFPAPGTATAGV